jgi:BirA family biotin operon repressor/biotin-[acetyl-CoA-carboxylase] ligase
MNGTTCRILELLRAQRAWLSGADIGAELGISRAAVSKHVGLLRKYGYRIESSSRRGYLFGDAPNVPNAAEVTPRLTTRVIGRPLVYHPVVDSTNTLAAQLARDGVAAGTTVVADLQSAGRGRLQRNWFSPPGANLYVSILLRPDVSPWRVGELPLVVAVALLTVLDARWPDLAAAVKWPNDVLVNGRKLCGILCESEVETDAVHYVIVGIGFNLNTEAFPAELRDIATSLRIETGTEVSRAALLADVLNAFEPDYVRWREADDLGPFVPRLTDRLAMKDRPVVVRNVRGDVSGTARGLSADGGLRLETDDGLITVMSGDVAAGGIHL